MYYILYITYMCLTYNPERGLYLYTYLFIPGVGRNYQRIPFLMCTVQFHLVNNSNGSLCLSERATQGERDLLGSVQFSNKGPESNYFRLFWSHNSVSPILLSFTLYLTNIKGITDCG